MQQLPQIPTTSQEGARRSFSEAIQHMHTDDSCATANNRGLAISVVTRGVLLLRRHYVVAPTHHVLYFLPIFNSEKSNRTAPSLYLIRETPSLTDRNNFTIRSTVNLPDNEYRYWNYYLYDNPWIEQAIYGLLRKAWIHGLRRTIHGLHGLRIT